MDVEINRKGEETGEVPSNEYYYSSQQLGIDNKTKRFLVEACMPYVRGARVLTLGIVDGMWTDLLLAKGFQVDVVEGARRHVAYARGKYESECNIRIYHALFEDFRTEESYDTIIAGDMVQYLDCPISFLRRAGGWLRSEGVLILTTPNPRSLHRRIGAYLDPESTSLEVTEADLRVGNKQLYDRHELDALLNEAGYEVQQLRGCFLKPLSSAQMTDWSSRLLNAFARMGEELGDYAWFHYAVCSFKADSAGSTG